MCSRPIIAIGIINAMLCKHTMYSVVYYVCIRVWQPSGQLLPLHQGQWGPVYQGMCETDGLTVPLSLGEEAELLWSTGVENHCWCCSEGAPWSVCVSHWYKGEGTWTTRRQRVFTHSSKANTEPAENTNLDEAVTFTSVACGSSTTTSVLPLYLQSLLLSWMVTIWARRPTTCLWLQHLHWPLLMNLLTSPLSKRVWPWARLNPWRSLNLTQNLLLYLLLCLLWLPWISCQHCSKWNRGGSLYAIYTINPGWWGYDQGVQQQSSLCYEPCRRKSCYLSCSPQCFDHQYKPA